MKEGGDRERLASGGAVVNYNFCRKITRMSRRKTGWGASADTIIASKAYVDARDATKQNTLSSASGGNVVLDANNNTGNVITNITATDGVITISKGNIASTDYVTNGDNALSMTDSTTKAPTIHAVQGMKTTSVRAASSAVDTLVPTESAVRTAIDTASGGITDQFEGNVADDGNGGFVVEGTEDAPDNVVVDSEHPNLIPRNYNIQKGIAYLEGTGIENHNKSNSDGVDADAISSTDSAWDTIISEKEADDYVPTIAAVEKRVLAAEEAAAGGLSDAIVKQGNADVTWTDSVTNANKGTSVHLIDAATAANRDNYVPTVKAVEKRIDSALSKSSESNIVSTLTARTNGEINANTGSDSKVPTTQLMVNVIKSLDQSTYGSDTATTGTGAVTKPVTAVTEKDGIITAQRGKITFEDAMENALKDVNNKNTDAVCSAASPCVLTYIGSQASGIPQFRWTNMDTDSTNASI